MRTARLLVSRLDETLGEMRAADPRPLVVVSTIQALQDVHAEGRHGDLVGAFSVVFFDEGHREPAPQWAKAARDLKAPMILLSATPYRNDFKLFDIDTDHISFLSFADAVGAGLIRPVEIVETDLPQSAVGFAAWAVAERDRLVAAGEVPAAAKMIVRAGSEDEVRALFEGFRRQLGAREDGVLALHYNLDDATTGRACEASEVPPDLSARTERFLVHQNMLIEGVDDPSCTLLALYSPFTNERQLVQQVGRLTRHPGPLGTPAAPAKVFARASEKISRMWERFLTFDRACTENGGKPPLKDSRFVDDLVAATPEIDYLDGQFRTRVDFSAEGLVDEIRAPRSAIVFDTADDFDFSEFLTALDEALVDEDRFVQNSRISDDGRTAHRLSVKLRQTPFLSESLFQSATLELTLVCRLGGRLYVYDSAGLAVDELPGLLGRIGPKALQTLLPRQSRVTSLTVRNTDLGPHSLRGRALTARSVETAGVFMGEQTYVVSRAAGFDQQTRRALGLTNSRVRDGDGTSATVSEFVAWCESVEGALAAQSPAVDLFGRFAAPIEPPADTTPLNILIDLDNEADRFRDADNGKVTFDPDSLCVDVTPTADGPRGYAHAFQMKVNGEALTVYIRWDRKKRKYWLKSTELSRICERDNPKVTLAARLNRMQPFRIILGGSTVFAYGQFYSVDLKLGQATGPGAVVLGLLTGLTEMSGLVLEKGALNEAADTWPDTSLFGVIDRALAPVAPTRPFGEPFTAVVCDDIGDEAADFIGVSEGSDERVVFVIAKWKAGEAGAGASGLYDVCGQAQKNLAYLKTDGQPLPGSRGRFDQDWRLNGGRVPRKRYGPGSVAFRSLFAKVRGKPNARREIWLVLGQGILSRKAVETAFKADNPEPHALQLFHLLLSTHAACQSVGVELKVFCAK